MKRSMLHKFLALCAIALVYSPVAEAKGDPRGWVGGLFGLSIPNEDNTTSRLGFGITGGAKIGSEFGVGGYFLSSAKDETIAGVSVPFNYDLYGVEAGIHFEGEARGVYLAGRLGTSKVKANNVTTSPMHWGAVAGYNHMLSDNFSLGGEVNYFSIASSSGTAPGSVLSTTIDAFGTLNFLASIKLWF